MKSFEEFKTEVKSRADIADVIGKHTKLQKTPRGYKACCPLPGHREKTPSFYVDAKAQLYYCYGCNRGGDIFKFLKDVEGLQFRDALEDLANKLGLQVPEWKRETPEDQERKSIKQAGFELLERSAHFFLRCLKESPEASAAREYLNKRGLSDADIEGMSLGWSPKRYGYLTERLEVDQKTLAEEVALVRRGDKGVYEFFRGRLMVPISDPKGRVVAFSGRTLEAVTGTNPKYINSSETRWFKKKETLYGLDRVLPLVRNRDFVVIVEGYFDQWALEKIQIPAVAVMGTALGPEHLRLLEKHTKKIVLLLDEDAAGRRSTLRVLPEILGRGFDIRVYTGLGGKDVDEVLRSQPELGVRLSEDLPRAEEAIGWWLAQILADATRERLSRTETLEHVAGVWRMAQTETDRQLLLERLEPILGAGFDRAAVSRQLQDLVKEQALGASSKAAKPAETGTNPSLAVVPRGARVSKWGASLSVNRLSSGLDRVALEALLLWVRRWDLLTPKIEAEFFEGTIVESFIRDWQNEAKAHGAPPDVSWVLGWVSRAPEGNDLVESLVRALVPQEEGLAEDDKVLNSFDELKRRLLRERILGRMALLRNQLQGARDNDETSARILRNLQELSLGLEKLK